MTQLSKAPYKAGFTPKSKPVIKGDQNVDLVIDGNESDDKPSPYGRVMESQDNPSLNLSNPPDMQPGKEGLK